MCPCHRTDLGLFGATFGLIFVHCFGRRADRVHVQRGQTLGRSRSLLSFRASYRNLLESRTRLRLPPLHRVRGVSDGEFYLN